MLKFVTDFKNISLWQLPRHKHNKTSWNIYSGQHIYQYSVGQWNGDIASASVADNSMVYYVYYFGTGYCIEI